MAIGMAFMFAPASIDHFNIPTGFWSLAFANGAIAIVLWMLVQAFAGRGTNLLWLLMAFDLGAMAYMWSPTGFQAPITWLLVAYFAVQAVLWGTNRMRDFDERTILGGAVSVTPEGALAASVAEPLICLQRPAGLDGRDDARHGLHVRRDAAGGVMSAAAVAPRFGGRPLVTTRGIQIALGLVWLLDGLFQFKSFMFTHGIVTEVFEPAMQASRRSSATRCERSMISTGGT